MQTDCCFVIGALYYYGQIALPVRIHPCPHSDCDACIPHINMSTRIPIRRSALLLLCALALTLAVAANSTSSHLELSIADLDHKLQECQFVQELNQQRLDALPETSSLMKRIFGILFPFGPAVNSLLATAYISGPPSRPPLPPSLPPSLPPRPLHN